MSDNDNPTTIEVVLIPNIARGWRNLGPYTVRSADNIVAQVTGMVSADLGVFAAGNIGMVLGGDGWRYLTIDHTYAYRVELRGLTA